MENYVIALYEDESKEPTKVVKTGYNYIALAEGTQNGTRKQ